MKKILSLFILSLFLTVGAFAQLPDGSTAPDWTLTDIDGVDHTLYDYLDEGYTVILDFSATWCNPCWNYHISGALEELYMNHGPLGNANVSAETTNDVMVFMIEGDASTTNAQLNGGAGSQGDWVTGTPYPIIDDASLTNAWVDAWPTLYAICPNGQVNIVGQDPTDAHYARVGYCALESYDISTSSVQDAASSNDFMFIAENTNDVDEVFKATMTTDHPGDWSASLTAAGVSGESEIEFSATAGVIENVTLNVIAGATAAYATYTVELESLTFPDSPTYSLEYNVLSGVTDLVVDNGGVATAMNVDFVNGLDMAGSTAYAVMNVTKYMDAVENNQLAEIEHIYYNMGWTFPSFTNDLVDALSTFMDNGGNFMVVGQDIGWDTWDPSTAANGTAQTQAFYTDYLRADYQGDGSGTNNLLTWDEDNSVFVDPGNSSIIDIHGGNIYPDEFDPINGSEAIFFYNNNESKVGGVRSHEDGHKVVYVGVDIAMIADEDVRNKVVQISHDWFHGAITGIEFNEAFAAAVGGNYPNPATEFTIIPFEDLKEDVTITLMDVQGKVIFSDNVAKGSNNYRLDLSTLNSGLYQFVLRGDSGEVYSSSVAVSK